MPALTFALSHSFLVTKREALSNLENITPTPSNSPEKQLPGAQRAPRSQAASELPQGAHQPRGDRGKGTWHFACS